MKEGFEFVVYWLAVVPLYAVQFALFLLPGLWIVIWLRRFRMPILPIVFVPCLAIAASAVLGYGAFWAYFADPAVGRWTSLLVIAAAVTMLAVPQPRRALVPVLRERDVYRPLFAMALLGLFFVGALYAFRINTLPEHVIYVRFTELATSLDNLIPWRFAERLSAGQDPRQILGDWLSSDRPPLQTGILLLQHPLTTVTPVPAGLQYQTLGTILQMSWVPAVWR